MYCLYGKSNSIWVFFLLCDYIILITEIFKKQRQNEEYNPHKHRLAVNISFTQESQNLDKTV